jgi:hypothetical protein
MVVKIEPEACACRQGARITLSGTLEFDVENTVVFERENRIDEPSCALRSSTLRIPDGEASRQMFEERRTVLLKNLLQFSAPSKLKPSFVIDHQYAPRANNTAVTVRARMYRSSHGDQLRM